MAKTYKKNLEGKLEETNPIVITFSKAEIQANREVAQREVDKWQALLDECTKTGVTD